MDAASGSTSEAGGAAPPPRRRGGLATSSWPDSAFDTRTLETSLDASLGRASPARWIGWRRRALVGLGALACLAVFLLLRALAATPWLDLQIGAGPSGELLLQGGEAVPPALRGQPLLAISAPGLEPAVLDEALLHRSPRWQVRDALRAYQLQQQRAVAERLARASVTLHFRDGARLTLEARPRGWSGLGALAWPLLAMALAVVLMGAAVWMARPRLRHGLYFVICGAQATNLAFVAALAMPGLGPPLGLIEAEGPWRTALDLISAAAALHAGLLQQERAVPTGVLGIWAALGWAVAALVTLSVAGSALAGAWWWTQLGGAALLASAWVMSRRAHRLAPNPFALVLQRAAAVTLTLWLLVTLVVATAAFLSGRPGFAAGAATVASALWTLFLGATLLFTTFLSRSQPLLREFAMLAGMSTVATSLDLLFVALFSLGPFASLTLAVFIALGVYAGLRQWLMDHLAAGEVRTAERTFEQVYRLAREVQARPARYPSRAAQLLRELFEPLELKAIERPLAAARVLDGGSTLAVPVTAPLPVAGGAESAPASAVVLRFARRGRRLFTPDDARLADRVIEQLRRAVAYDQAVERGRTEERLRIAQDLHDDIGARLLTLMYQAQTPEMEDYIRHTLKDLKTLSRGLAAGEHQLSHAAAEWKSDLVQRLAPAHVELGWSFAFDDDRRLSVVQWSALTRVLRELVSNSLAHAGASRIDVSLVLERGRLALTVADDGTGSDPQAWKHGLGLGGVRKRVKQLGGEVRWRENPPRGIACDVVLPMVGSGE